LVRDGQVLTIDEEEVRLEAQRQADGVAAKVKADPVHREMALMSAMAQGQL
jgi:hypothetical protein